MLAMKVKTCDKRENSWHAKRRRSAKFRLYIVKMPAGVTWYLSPSNK